MRVLVTGGAGFLGSHLCEKLVLEGHHVICLDNFFSGRHDNIEKLLSKPNFEVIRHDVQNPILLEVDQIYHLACPASPVFYQYRALETMKTSVLGTINMMDLAVRCNATILLASTSEIYGDPEVHPQLESYHGNVNTLGIRSCYDEGKRAAEAITMDYHRTHNVNVRIARIFNTYGPRMYEDDGRVVSNFIVQALKGVDITVFGKGDQTRSFCYCIDTVNGLHALMNGDHIGPMNIGMPLETTIKQLAEKVLELVPDTKSKLIFKKQPSDDPTRRLPNIDKARALLNWSPVMPLDEGIKNTVEYFRDQLIAKTNTETEERKQQRKQVTRDREAHEARRHEQVAREEELVRQFIAKS